MLVVKTEERFWRNVHKTDGCWPWLAALNHGGYGVFSDGRYERAHRYSWKLHNGTIPDGLCVLHSCDRRDCVNPAHLRVGTRQDNADDMRRRGGYLRASLRMAKLKTKHILAIRQSEKSNADLAKLHGVHRSHVCKIRSRERWASIH